MEREHEREDFQQEIQRLEEQLRQAARPWPRGPRDSDVSQPARGARAWGWGRVFLQQFEALSLETFLPSMCVKNASGRSWTRRYECSMRVCVRPSVRPHPWCCCPLARCMARWGGGAARALPLAGFSCFLLLGAASGCFLLCEAAVADLCILVKNLAAFEMIVDFWFSGTVGLLGSFWLLWAFHSLLSKLIFFHRFGTVSFVYLFTENMLSCPFTRLHSMCCCGLFAPFLWPHLQHVEVSEPRGRSGAAAAGCTTATARPDP